MLRGVGGVLRGLGQAIDAAGVGIQGKNAYVEKLPLSARLVAVGNKVPTTVGAAFVAPNASVIGDVALGADASVFYGSVVRGDKGSVSVGSMTTVGDNSVLGSAQPTTIGSGVYIGAACTLGGCTIGDGAHVGGGSVVCDGAVVEPRAVLAPGTFVPAGGTVPAAQLWAGSPAAYVRDVVPFESEQLLTAAGGASWLAKLHDHECAKTPAQVEEDTAAYEDEWERGDEYASTILNYVKPEPLPVLAGFTYALQLRTYFELEAAVRPEEDSIVYLDENQDAQEVMDDVLLQSTTGPAVDEEKKSYWFVN